MRKIALLVVVLLLARSVVAAADPGGVITELLSLPIPSELEFCGESVPLDREDVAERLEVELIVALANPVSASLWFKRGARFFPMIDKKIREKDLPDCLRYVPVVESNLRADAVSSARAVGPWQFIRATGRRYGLDRTSWKDERRHWEEATEAGLDHLKDLYDDLGSWPLALAAYNAGKRRVSGAMQTQGEKDYYSLRLPRETERYVMRIMAVQLMMENPGDYGIDLTAARLYTPEGAVEVKVEVKRGRLPLLVLADSAGLSFRGFRRLNPWITGDALPRGTYRIKVPAAAELSFDKELAAWRDANPEPKIVYHKVRRGDTLSGIATKYGVRLKDLLAWNSLSVRSVIRPGQRIAVRRR